MFTGVVTAGDMNERILSVCVRSPRQDFSSGIVFRERGDNITHAPGPAQIEAIEMDQLRIGTIRNRSRREQHLRLASLELRQETMKPTGKRALL